MKISLRTTSMERELLSRLERKTLHHRTFLLVRWMRTYWDSSSSWTLNCWKTDSWTQNHWNSGI